MLEQSGWQGCERCQPRRVERQEAKAQTHLCGAGPSTVVTAETRGVDLRISYRVQGGL